MDFLALVKEKAKVVEIDEALVKRPVNEGFSGGEKKRNEIFQMACWSRPCRARETDSASTSTPCASWPGGEPAAHPGAVDGGGDALPAPPELHRPRLVHVLVEGRIGALERGKRWPSSSTRRATRGSRRSPRPRLDECASRFGR